VRIYFGTRDKHNRTSIAYIEAKADNPSHVLHVHDRPVLTPGRLGTFDDSGVMPSCIVRHGGRLYHYYIGWNVGTTVRFRNSIGLAVTDEADGSLRRLFEGPVMDRTHTEPHFVVTPYVRIEDGIWKMWYCGCTCWHLVNGISEPRYQIKYAESSDGIHWRRDNVVCIPYRDDREANARPCIFKETGIYKMWYCYRSIQDYRTKRANAYRIGYAESTDGKEWTRKDDETGIDRSEDGWDSEMMAYPFVYEYAGRKYMLYNGNGFGKSGFGYAVLDEE
jgi:hypothetical protein